MSWSWFVLGAGVLVPWNAWITARYPYVHADRWITVTYLPITFISVFVLSVTVTSPSFSTFRVYGGFAMYIACLVVAPMVTALPILLLFVGISAFADALAQAALFGLAGSHQDDPKRCTQLLASGTSISGIFTSLLWIATRAVLPDAAAEVAYFWTCAALCFAAVFSYRHWYGRGGLSVESPTNLSSTRTIAETTTTVAKRTATPREPLQVEPATMATRHVSSDVLSVLRKVYGPLFALTAVYWVTISIFPGVLQEDVSSSWTPPIAILLFNVCDAIGKFLEPLPITSRALLTATASRVLFIPMFLAAIAVHAHGAAICLLAAALGVTNGWLTITAFDAIQTNVDDEDEYLAGQVAVAFLMLGLNLGAGSSWLIAS